jgi:DNA invertase Pin-like site-specific DNA recombinase
MDRVEDGEAQGILVWHINRLSRNPVDSGRISWMLQQNVIQSIQTMEREYLPDDNVLLLSVESGMANQFIIDLKKSSRRGMESKADKGHMPSNAPIGYLNDVINNVIVKDPERFDLVRKMWDMMLTGNYKPIQIMRIANNEWGFRTKKSKKSGGGELVSSVIYRIFTNIFYTGAFTWSGQVYTNGKHPAMISNEEYDRVQIILGKDGKPRPKTHDGSGCWIESARYGRILIRARPGARRPMTRGTERFGMIIARSFRKSLSRRRCASSDFDLKPAPSPERPRTTENFLSFFGRF